MKIMFNFSPSWLTQLWVNTIQRYNIKFVSYGVILILWVTLWGTAPAWANNPAEVVQTLNTRTCVGCDLSGANLILKKLDRSQLLSSDFRQANLQGVSLRFSNLNRGKFNQANLLGANLSYSLLRLADLRGANMSYVRLTDADLSGAMLDETTNLNHTTFCHTIMPDGKINDQDCPQP